MKIARSPDAVMMVMHMIAETQHAGNERSTTAQTTFLRLRISW